MKINKVIVITGGAGFLGRQFCAAVAESGGIAIVADIDFEAARRVAEMISANHLGMAVPALLDITSTDSVKALLAEIHQQHGRIDAVVNNAYPRNLNYGRKLEDVAYADFCENVDLHLGGYFLVAQQFALYFREHGGGSIINMSSIYGVMPPRFEVYEGTQMTMPVEYAAIKSAVIHLTRYFAQYFKSKGIRVNCISPGGILDDQPSIFLENYKKHCNSDGMLSTQDLSGMVIFLLSDAAEKITGQNFIIDDGFSL
ncbi:oxidoreductase [Methylicorpusculum sp.]|uniref:oxidoreductase n=1 Tax=Methylicorpusculum sp. TaxID=2713644 RepID=UPI002ABA2BC9|nr:oxidoreductase [Methylicorpusculum sp.]MDZ4150150.1 oxidoreductase [Methylicorpusculum sp.]